MIRKKLAKIFREQEFYPNFLSLFVHPAYFARKGLVENVKVLAKHINGKVLDVGCGTKPYQRLFNFKEYIGLELDTPENRQHKNADFFYDGERFPFKGAEFDSVVANEVLEHVFNPEVFLRETNRVLKINGHFLLTVPFVWDEHEQPFDYARYSSFGIKYILEKHGFKVLEHRKSVNDIRVVFQFINSYIKKKVNIKNRYFKLLIFIILISPANILGSVLYKILPQNNDLYLDNIVLSQKIK